MTFEPDLAIQRRWDKAVIVCECKIWAALVDIDGKSYCRMCTGKIIKALVDVLNVPRGIEHCLHNGKETPYPTKEDLF